MRIQPVLRPLGMAALIMLGAAVAAPTAHAWWRGGFGFGFVPFAPYAAPYPYYYPPPAIYAPPAYYPPAPAPGQACYAGPYVCPLAAPTPLNAACSCPTNDGGRAGGRVG